MKLEEIKLSELELNTWYYGSNSEFEKEEYLVKFDGKKYKRIYYAFEFNHLAIDTAPNQNAPIYEKATAETLIKFQKLINGAFE